MEARMFRAVLWACLLAVSMGARTSTPNFVVETADPQFCQQTAQTAEYWRRELAVAWLGSPMPNWSAPCVMTVHAAPNLGAGGATTFVFDRGEVFGWRMTIQGSPQRLLDSVLPHEITHMILATHFRRPVPRWADEGAATSVEHAAEKDKYSRMLVQFLQTGHGIAFNKMFAMKEYPRDAMPLYAQGFSLAEYLIQQGGKQRFLAFVGDGMKDNQWHQAVQRHYGIADLGVLQTTWLGWVRQGSPRLAPRAEGQPLLAGPLVPVLRQRPEPNLILRLPKEDPVAAVASAAPAATPGWQAPGAAALPATSSPAAAPIRTQLTRPQPLSPLP